MALEVGTFIDDLVVTNPPGTDPKQQGDDHIRLIKTVLKNTLVGATRALAFPTSISKTTTYVVLATDENAVILADTSGGAFTITLPANALVFTGWQVTIVLEVGGNDLTVDGDGADTINGTANRLVGTVGNAESYMWTGSEWTVTNDYRAYPPSRTETGTPYAVTMGDRGKLVAVDATAAGATVDLPAVATAGNGFSVTIKKIDVSANTVIIDGSGAETVEDSATLVLSIQYDSVTLICDGAEWFIVSRNTQTSGISTTGRLLAITILTATSGTHTYDADTVNVLVEGVGAGGGGGGNGSGGTRVGGGGGGGEFSSVFFAKAGADDAFVIATGGAGGTAGANNGNAGSGNTTYNVTTMVASPGSGGPHGDTSGAGGAGGTGGTGDLLLPGSSGGGTVSDAADNGGGGEGGASGGGFGAGTGTQYTAVGQAVGIAGPNYGSGGQGAMRSTGTDQAGGAGANGMIRVTEYS